MITEPFPLRPRLTQHLAQRLQAFGEGFRHNLAIVGPVGSGKSTLLRQALQAADPQMLTISCAFHAQTPVEVIQQLCEAVLAAVVGPAPDEAEDTLLQRAGAIAPQTVEALRPLWRLKGRAVSTDTFLQTLELIPTLHRELNRPCALILDEFLALERLGLAHAFHELGKRVMTWPFTLFVVTSSSVHRAQEILRERLQLLFGQFELLSLGAIDVEPAMAWMEAMLPRLRHQPDAMRFLLHWVGGSPWYVGLVVNRMRERMLLERQTRPSATLMTQAAWDLLGHPDGALYHWCAAQLERLVNRPHGALARQALLAMAQGHKTTSAIAEVCGSRRRLAQGLQLLVEHDLAQRKGACWVLTDPLLACWLCHASAQPDQARMNRRAASDAFIRAMEAMWLQWQAEDTQPFAAQISRLLSKFRNETVSLDHKVGRLSSFQSLQAQPSADPETTYVVADGSERRWCCLVHDGRLEEAAVAAFEQFCRDQSPRPSRKVVIARQGVELNARLLAKAANMWVWEPGDLATLLTLYRDPQVLPTMASAQRHASSLPLTST